MSAFQDLNAALSKAEDDPSEYYTAFAPDENDEQALVVDEDTGKFIVGAEGLESSGGTITEEWKPELQSGQAIKVYREMSDNDAIVGAILSAIQMLIRQVEWRADPAAQDGEEISDDEDTPPDDEEPEDIEEAELQKADDSRQAEENALFLKQVMHDMETTWAELISEILSMLAYGWSYHEIVYKTRGGPDAEEGSERSQYSDGKLGWRKLPIRAQDTLERWEFDDFNDIVGMWQIPAPDYQLRYVPMDKALLFRTSVHKNNPEGKSILRNAYRSYVFKKRFEEVEGVGVERDLAGIPIAYVDPAILDPDASTKDKAILAGIKDIVANIRRDTQDGVIWPRVFDDNGNSMYELSLLTSGGGRQFNTGEIIDRYDRRMAQSVLADFIMMGHETVGSFALSSSKTRLFAVALGAWMDMITGVFNDVAIPKLFKLNGITDNIPKLTHTDLEIPDLNELADFIAKLAGVGIIFDDDATEDHLRQVAKLPQRPLGEKRIRDQITDAREEKVLNEVTTLPEDPKELREEQFAREDQLREEDRRDLAESDKTSSKPPR